MSERVYCVYTMANKTRGSLYIGISSRLKARVREHKSGAFEGFTAKYKLHRLVYYETYRQILHALDREKQLKHWRRSKQEAVIESMNPNWLDLSAEWEKPAPTHHLKIERPAQRFPDENETNNKSRPEVSPLRPAKSRGLRSR